MEYLFAGWLCGTLSVIVGVKILQKRETKQAEFNSFAKGMLAGLRRAHTLCGDLRDVEARAGSTSRRDACTACGAKIEDEISHVQKHVENLP